MTTLAQRNRMLRRAQGLNAPQAAAPQPNAAPTVPDVERLDAMLTELIGEHETLLGLTHEHRAAVATADMKKLESVVEQTGEVIARVHRVETERQKLVARPDGRPSTMDELLTVVDSADRERLSERATSLRGLIHKVQEEQEAVRVASEALATHMRGIMQQVASKLSHAGTYSRGGRVESGRQIVSGVDVGA